MKEGDISTLNQLLLSMQEAVKVLEGAINSQDMEKINAAKKSILSFQKEIEKIQ